MILRKIFVSRKQRAEEKYPWLTAEIESRAKEIIAEVLAEQDGIDPDRLEEEENLLEKY